MAQLNDLIVTGSSRLLGDANTGAITASGMLTPNGGVRFTGDTALPQFSGSPPYILGIEAFNAGGQVKWQSASSCSVGYATSAGSASPTSGSSYYIQNCTNSSRSTATTGSWISMVNSSQTGSPTLPTNGKWWTVLSADCWNSAPNNWVSQLALATQDGSGVWWRRNDTGGTSIDSSTWHRLAEGDSNGNALYAVSAGSATDSTKMPLAGGTFTGMVTHNKSIHGSGGDTIYGAEARNSQWYKLTLATNGLTPPASSNQWYMCSFTLNMAGDYGDTPKGSIYVSYYLYWNKSTFSAEKVFATAFGNNMNRVKVYYKLTDPFILYIESSNTYSAMWVDKISYRDSGNAYRTLDTILEATDAISASGYSTIPTACFYTPDGSQFISNSSILPYSNDYYNLGASNTKWANGYFTNINGVAVGDSPKFTDNNTTYTLSTSGNNIVLTPSSGSANTITVPYATSAGSASPTSGSGYYIRRDAWWNMGDTHTVDSLKGGTTFAYSTHDAPAAGTIVAFDCSTSESYTLQLMGNYYSNRLYYRNRNGDTGTWGSWRTLIDNDNIANQSVYYANSAGSANSATTATTASKLGSSTVGSATNPIYLNGGTATACTYSLNKTVPSDAVFTDTNNAVTQTFTTSATGKHEILFANTEDDTTTTEGTLKTDTLSFYPNPSSSYVSFDVGLPGVSINGSKYAMGGYGRIYVWKSGVLSPVIDLNGDNGKITCNSMNVQDISSLYTFSKSSGSWTYQGIRAVRSGNVVQMQIIIKGGTSVSAGSNGIVGTLSGGPLPAKVDSGTQDILVSGVNFYGTSAMIGTLTSSGTFTLRLLIAAQSLGSNTTSVCLSFVCD